MAHLKRKPAPPKYKHATTKEVMTIGEFKKKYSEINPASLQLVGPFKQDISYRDEDGREVARLLKVD